LQREGKTALNQNNKPQTKKLKEVHRRALGYHTPLPPPQRYHHPRQLSPGGRDSARKASGTRGKKDNATKRKVRRKRAGRGKNRRNNATTNPG